MINRKFVALLFMMNLSLCASAQEVREYFNGARMMGMGGASIAVVNDETALLSNPAGLGKLRDTFGTILDPEFDFGQNVNGIYTQSPFQDPFNLGQVASSLNSSKNTYYHARTQIFPSFVVKNFGIGIFYKYVLDMKMNAAGTAAETFYQEDVALHLGYNFRFFDGRIKLGVAGKLISRVELNQAAMTYPGNFGLQQNGTEGVALGADVGLNLAAPWTWLPTLAVVARDVGGTQFTAGKNLRYMPTTSPIPSQMFQDFDVALAVFPIHANRTRSSFTIEAQKIQTAATAANQLKYLHVGYELNHSDVFFFRLGMNGPWYTAGFEIASEKIQAQFATYGEDVGQGTTLSEDRRYILKFAFRF